MTEDIVRRLCGPVEGALTLLSNSESILKGYQAELKAPLAMLRLRLFQTLALLPANALQGSYPQLLRLLVAEFTLADSASSTGTSLLRTLCHADDSFLTLGPAAWSRSPSSGMSNVSTFNQIYYRLFWTFVTQKLKVKKT